MNLQYLQEVQVRNLQFLQEVQVRNLCSKQLRYCVQWDLRYLEALGCSVPSAARALLRALGFLNTVDPLDTVSNCYLDHSHLKSCNVIGQQQGSENS